MAQYTSLELVKGLFGSVNKVRVACWILWESDQPFTGSDILQQVVSDGTRTYGYLRLFEGAGMLERTTEHDRPRGSQVYRRTDSAKWPLLEQLFIELGVNKENWEESIPRRFA